MTAGPPPTMKLEATLLGLEMGAIYGVASALYIGWWSTLFYMALGSFIGFICDQYTAD